MAITVTAIGKSASGLSTTTHTLVAPVPGVPKGSVVVVLTNSSSAVLPALPADGANTYNVISQKSYNGNNTGCVFYSILGTSISSGTNLTFTSSQAVASVVDWFYLTGASTTAPLDAAVTQTATTTTTAASVTSNNSAWTTECFVGATMTSSSATLTITRQSTTSGWATVPSSGTSGTQEFAAGNFISTSTAATAATWATTLSAQALTLNVVIGFIAATSVSLASNRLRTLVGVGV